MSIEAMKQVIELYDKHCYNNDYGGIEFNRKHGYKFIEAIEALRTAIQQAEAKTDDPAVWGWAIVDNKGLERQTRARTQDFFGSIQEAKPFDLEDVAREDREFAGCAPHLVITLYAHPAPGAPDDVMRDADRLDWLARNPVDALDVFGKSRPDEARFIRATIDAAMLAAQDRANA